MEIEVVGIFPEILVGRRLYATAHVYMCDIGMDIRGILFCKVFETENIIVEMPAFWGPDYDEGLSIRYPVISFMDKEKSKEFVDAVKEGLQKELEGWKCPENVPRKRKLDWSVTKLPFKKASTLTKGALVKAGHEFQEPTSNSYRKDYDSKKPLSIGGFVDVSERLKYRKK